MIKCPNKNCKNKWIKENVNTIITCCGGNLRVCDKCKQEGLSVYNGQGDGLFYLRKNGVQIDVYNYKIAYNIKFTPNEIHDHILEKLSNGSLPCLDNIKKSELQQYSNFLKDADFIEKDDDYNWSCEKMTHTFNDYFKEIESKTRLEYIKSPNNILMKNIQNNDRVFFKMFIEDCSRIVWFDIENVKFGYLNN